MATIRNQSSKNGATKVARKPEAPAVEIAFPAPSQRRTTKIATVSHTLDAEIAERLRHFAFRERISESAVIEFSLRTFFNSGEEGSLGDRLREAGAALRRKT